MTGTDVGYYERRIKLHEIENSADENRAEYEIKILDIYHGLWYDYLTELRYNHNHDPSNGRFCSGGGAASDNYYHDSSGEIIKITDEAIKSVPDFDEFDSPELNAAVKEACIAVLSDVKDCKPNTEALALINISENKIEVFRGEEGEGTVPAESLNVPYISVHNHPSGETFSLSDVEKLYEYTQCQCIVVISNNGQKVYILKKTNDYISGNFYPYIRKRLKGEIKGSDEEFLKGAEQYGVTYSERSD